MYGTNKTASSNYATDYTCFFSEKPSIVYGGITEDFIHAKKTEDYLLGK